MLVVRHVIGKRIYGEFLLLITATLTAIVYMYVEFVQDILVVRVYKVSSVQKINNLQLWHLLYVCVCMCGCVCVGVYGCVSTYEARPTMLCISPSKLKPTINSIVCDYIRTE